MADGDGHGRPASQRVGNLDEKNPMPEKMRKAICEQIMTVAKSISQAVTRLLQSSIRQNTEAGRSTSPSPPYTFTASTFGGELFQLRFVNKQLGLFRLKTQLVTLKKESGLMYDD